MAEKTINQLAAGTGMGVAGRFGGRLLGMLADIIAARILGPAVYGLYAIGWTIFRLAELAAPLGLDVGAIRYGAEYLDRDEAKFKGVILRSGGYAGLAGLLLGGLFFLLAPWLAGWYHKPGLLPVFRLFAFAFPLGALLAVAAAATRITKELKYSVIVQDIGQPLAGLGLLVIFYLLGARLFGVILSEVLSYLLAVIASLYYVRKLFPRVFEAGVRSERIGGELLAFSIPAAMATVFTTLVFWVDRLLVGYFLGAAETGIYQAASHISVVFAVILGGLSRIIIPLFAELQQQSDRHMLVEVFRVGTKWGIYLGAPVIILLLISPGASMSVLYGGAYAAGGQVLFILLIGQAVNLITGPVGPALVMTGYQNAWFALSGMALAANVLLNVVLIPALGLQGAAIATSISLSGLFILALVFARWRLGAWPYDRRFAKPLVAGGAAAAAVFVVSRCLHFSNLGMLLVEGIAAVLVFFGLLVLLRLDDEDWELVRVLRGMLFA